MLCAQRQIRMDRASGRHPIGQVWGPITHMSNLLGCRCFRPARTCSIGEVGGDCNCTERAKLDSCRSRRRRCCVVHDQICNFSLGINTLYCSPAVASCQLGQFAKSFDTSPAAAALWTTEMTLFGRQPVGNCRAGRGGQAAAGLVHCVSIGI